jgi:hypothetical protein
MQNSLKKILLLTLAFAFHQLSNAQYYSKSRTDTLIDHLNIAATHKDGYDFAGRVINIPAGIVQKYHTKKAMLIEKSGSYKIKKQTKHENGDTIIYQERNNVTLPYDSEDVERTQYWTGTTFDITSISIWENTKRRWKIVYVKKDNNQDQ